MHPVSLHSLLVGPCICAIQTILHFPAAREVDSELDTQLGTENFEPAAHPTIGSREVERSALVNEEIVYFIFQLELDAQLQRALNYEAYEAAQQIRSKRETVRVGRSFRAVGSVTVAVHWLSA
jgi:hypothetical protein